MADPFHRPVLAYAIVPRLLGGAVVVEGRPALLPAHRIRDHAATDAEKDRIAARVRSDVAWCKPEAIVIDPETATAAAVEAVRTVIADTATALRIPVVACSRHAAAVHLGLPMATARTLRESVADRYPTLLFEARRPSPARGLRPRTELERYWSPGMVAAALALTVFAQNPDTHA